MKVSFACGNVVFNRPSSPIALCILAHGAGLGMNSGFMGSLATALATQQIMVARFEFPYMQKTTLEGKRRPPDRAERLIEHWHQVVTSITQWQDLQLPYFLAGKSMGGRMALMAVDQIDRAKGAIGFGYPFYGRGKNQTPRLAPLEQLQKSSLIIQGTRDPMGNYQQVKEFPQYPAIELAWLESGDHDFTPRKSSGLTQVQHIETAAKLTANFIRQHNK